MNEEAAKMKNRFLFWFAFFVISFTSLSSAYNEIPKIKMPYSHPKSYFESHADLSIPERERIQLHLSSVEKVLRENSPTELSAKQLQARYQRLDSLHAYWVRGEFPKNIDFPDSLVPYFIDAKGVPCAVGYLVISSGYKEFAEEIAHKQNHAYIGEITDPRLQKWATESGLSLEECARIQPGYQDQSHSYQYIRSLDFDSLNRPWIVGSEGLGLCSCIPSSLAFWEGFRWNVLQTGHNFQNMCMSPTGQPLVISSEGYLWNGHEFLGNDKFSSCEWSHSGDEVWMGGKEGITRFYVQNLSTLTRSSKIFNGPFDTSISVLAVGNTTILSGNASGLSVNLLPSAASNFRLDSATLLGKAVTGLLSGGGDSMWIGMDGPSIPIIYDLYGKQLYYKFSSKGLLHITEKSGWVSHRRNNSALPSDTLQAIAYRGGDSLWIACDSGLYAFTPPLKIRRVTKLNGKTITTMKVDKIGRLFVGTTAGLYMLDNDSLKALNYPTVAIRSEKTKNKSQSEIALKFQTDSKISEAHSLLTITGRKPDRKIASGVFIKESNNPGVK